MAAHPRLARLHHNCVVHFVGGIVWFVAPGSRLDAAVERWHERTVPDGEGALVGHVMAENARLAAVLRTLLGGTAAEDFYVKALLDPQHPDHEAAVTEAQAWADEDDNTPAETPDGYRPAPWGYGGEWPDTL